MVGQKILDASLILNEVIDTMLKIKERVSELPLWNYAESGFWLEKGELDEVVYFHSFLLSADKW